jgi:hypothetical protein
MAFLQCDRFEDSSAAKAAAVTPSFFPRLAIQLAVGLVLLFPLSEAMHQFELLTRIPVTGLPRSIVIFVVCGFLPQTFFRFYEIRRRA